MHHCRTGFTPSDKPYKFPAGVAEALRGDCWADDFVYRFAKEFYASQIAACGM